MAVTVYTAEQLASLRAGLAAGAAVAGGTAGSFVSKVPDGQIDRVILALDRALDRLGPELQAQKAQITDPDTLTALAVMLGIWAGLQFTPAGPIADFALAALGYFQFGQDGQRLIEGARAAAQATTNEQLDQAAATMAASLPAVTENPAFASKST